MSVALSKQSMQDAVKDRKIGEILLAKGLLEPFQLDRALKSKKMIIRLLAES